MAAATLDRAFDALANDCRRDIVLRLSEQPLETPVLLDAYDMSRQAFNRHLKVLEDAGLIERELHGRVHRVALVGPAIDEVTDWLSAAIPIAASRCLCPAAISPTTSIWPRKRSAG